MKFVKITIVSATHEYAALGCANNRGDSCVKSNGHVCSVKVDWLARSVEIARLSGEGDTKETYMKVSTNDEDMGDFVNEYAGFSWNEGYVGDVVWLVNIRVEILPV
jgi:hypothetical protein